MAERRPLPSLDRDGGLSAVAEAAKQRHRISSRLDALAGRAGIALELDSPMAPVTTLRVGGPADRLAAARSRDELLAALRLARDAGAPWFVLGNGSDLVVADAGIRGLVIRNRARHVTIDRRSGLRRTPARRWRCW